MTARAFLQTVIGTVDRYRLIQRGDVIVAGVSGGPDSVALAEALRRMTPRYGLTLHLAHVNHRLRGIASDADERFVASLARRWNLPFHAVRVRIQRRPQVSLEEAARDLRYDRLGRIARAVGASKVAVGHHQDDQAETVVMRLLRGTGWEGLGGMAPVQSRGRFLVLRPLLEVTRKNIRAFLRVSGLSYRQDATNLQEEFFRNRVRRRVLPVLVKYQPAAVRQLAQLAEIARAEEEWLEPGIKAALRRVLARRSKGTWSADADRLLRLPVALQRRVVRRGLEAALGHLRGLGFVHVEAVREACRDRIPRAIPLPHGLRGFTRKGRLVLTSPREP